jgi:hypothetical protein
MYGARAVARGTLYASRTARDATYDTRNATIPTSMIGDAIEGTLGRTKYGKMAGLNDMQIGNIPVMAGVSDAMGAGQGGKKSVMDERKESADRVAKRDKDNAKELKLAQAKDKVKKGADDANAQQNDIDEMEKALAKLSEKEIEAMVDGDKKLLDSQNFANSLSIKQLEALNKSELLDSGDKARLKDSRFKDINTAMAALSIPAANRNPQQIAAINSMTKNIRDLHNSELEMLDANYLSDSDFVNNLKPSQIEAINKSSSFSSTQKDAMLGIRFEAINTAMAAGGIVANSPAASAVRSLSDSELEIINANYLNDPTFIAQLKSSQIEAINKSNNFTRNQKDNLRTIRRAPLDAALATNNQQAAIQIVQEMSPEEVAALGPNTINNVNLHSAYTVNMLKRMAVKMSTRDIGSLRSLLTPAGSAARADTRTWLNSQNGLENFS